MENTLTSASRPRKVSLRTLPTEIHLQIASYLPYPDALALKHTNRYFYSFVHTGIALKVGWVIDRSSRHLQVPGKSCEFRTDETFCRGEVKRIMEKRRWHMECKPHPGGCFVVEGASCGGGSPLRLLRKGQTVLLLKHMGVSLDGQAILIALVVCCIAIFWNLTKGLPFSWRQNDSVPVSST